MRLFARLAVSTARPSFSRTISSLGPGHLLQGAKWGYRIVDAVKGDNTHVCAVFKAEVIPRENDPNTPQWAIIKKALPDDKIAKENLKLECQNYRLPGVASATCFRKLYDVIDNHTIALEWLDFTLADIKYQPDTLTYAIIKVVLEETLKSCVVLERQQYVNTDFKPANVLLSGVDTGCIIAKVGDLGRVVPDSYLFHGQPHAMRAPEVFLGQPCTTLSQVWAVAAMLLCWIKPGVLGQWDSHHPLIMEAWCMAKIKRLFPEWRLPSPDKVEPPTLKSALESVIILSKEQEILQAILPFAEETQKVDMPHQLRDLLRLMLVVHPSQRPSASDVLASREFKAFQTI